MDMTIKCTKLSSPLTYMQKTKNIQVFFSILLSFPFMVVIK